MSGDNHFGVQSHKKIDPLEHPGSAAVTDVGGATRVDRRAAKEDAFFGKPDGGVPLRVGILQMIELELSPSQFERHPVPIGYVGQGEAEVLVGRPQASKTSLRHGEDLRLHLFVADHKSRRGKDIVSPQWSTWGWVLIMNRNGFWVRV
jgi:hypothetical protein